MRLEKKSFSDIHGHKQLPFISNFSGIYWTIYSLKVRGKHFLKNLKKRNIWDARYRRFKMKERHEGNLKENGKRRSQDDCSEKMKRATRSILRHMRKL